MSGADITLYGNFLSAPTYKVGLMLALTGTPFAYRHVDLSKGQHKTPEFLALNRWGQVPVLVHGKTPIVQSNVIIEYLADLTGRFGGADAAARREAREWLYWETDRLSPPVNRTRFFTRFMKPDPAVADYFRNLADTQLRTFDSLLDGRTYLVGTEPTIADIGVYGNIVHLGEGQFDLADHPNLAAWFKRMETLPGWKAPYDLLPASS